MPSPASLTLAIPGLIWPAQTFADLTHDLSLPALSRLLDSARLETLPAATCDEVVARYLGIAGPLPGAALRRIELGQTDDTNHWLCLDPIHLGFVERKMIVGDPQELALTLDEAQELAVSLAPTFAQFGELQVTTPQEWHLRLIQAEHAPLTAALPELIGRRADLGLTALDKAWRQALNDAQIALHVHPVNRARETAGKPMVNSLWPWGGGGLPRHPVQPAQFATLWSNAAELRGLARYLEIDTAPLPASYPALPGQSTLAVLDALAQPARRADAQSWRETLVCLEQDWFAPLLANLPPTLHINFIGDTQSLSLSCSRRGVQIKQLAFWRTPAGLNRLTLP
jgi:hypothetical protein